MLTDKKINSAKSKSRILIAPLDWGLGHATRCVPIIKELIAANTEVIVAAKGPTKFLLEKEFPELIFLELNGYEIKYSRTKKLLPLKILVQIPKILVIAYKEYLWLKKVINKYNIDAVISDNRPGLFNKKIPCIYITHQLLIKTGSKIFDKISQAIHYSFIKKYNECWVPDFKDRGIAGELSHPKNLPENVKYIGAISRFEKVQHSKKYDLLILLSGPEPQRTILENIFLKQLKNFDNSFLLVRGLLGNKNTYDLIDHPENTVNHISATDLSEAIQQSSLIISRSGYSTIMDLVKLRQNAVLIPTPGQTEQEYLAKFLMEKNFFYSVEQDDFILNEALKKASAFSFEIPEYDLNEYKKTIKKFVASIHS